ncbi:hypothetical protein E2P81_ATG07570 [Venturia nashicola]|uniref:Uncharacterized protein n=1 Tax=Venturia nashicola TaxID=86259 RepID=A0A4Z1NYL5_9PEZI|nr:hypothetical protein E6O75_ATG07729 [Venturia nashicola]TLD32080.1 hypothetical protein E2P81_ATG07570 [Venturia nashicola]
MKTTLEHTNGEYAPLLVSTSDDYFTSKTTPENSPGSFWTGLWNVQFLNLVSVSVNVSTNHEEERERGQEDRNKHTGSPELQASKERRQQAKNNGLQDSPSNDGPQGSFSTLLRSFQIFSLVSVLVNVSTNHEDERTIKSNSKGKKKVPDYCRNIFGEEGKIEEGMGRTLAISHAQKTHFETSRIPILFRLRDSDRTEALTVSSATTYTDLVTQISELAKSSPNCDISSTIHAPLPNAQDREDVYSGIKVVEIDMDWNMGETTDRSQRTKLTEENCEAVLLLIERGMTGVLDVKIEERKEEEGRVQHVHLRNGVSAETNVTA